MERRDVILHDLQLERESKSKSVRLRFMHLGKWFENRDKIENKQFCLIRKIEKCIVSLGVKKKRYS